MSQEVGVPTSAPPLAHEEAFYELATNELSDNRLAPAIWGRALSETSGDKAKAQALYIKLRVEQLSRMFQESKPDFLYQLWPNIAAGKAFLCPFCQRVSKAGAVDDFFVRLFTGAPKRYYCQACNHKIKPPQLLPVQNPVSTHPGNERIGVTEKRNNPMAVTAFVVGIVGIVLHVIGLIPIVGIVLSGIALASFKPETQKNRWMAGWGLGLNIVGTLLYLNAYGHLG